MAARDWTMAAALPIMMAVFGLATEASAEGAKDCRQYVPGAGVTIAVECGQPVAAMIVASATATCRRYIPGAGMAMEVDCQDDVAPRVEKSVSVAPPAVSEARPADKGKPVAVGAPVGTQAKAVKPERLEKAAAKVEAGSCAGALERAQLGSETDRDLNALRSGCSSGG